MATRRYSLGRNQSKESDITEAVGAAIVTSSIELTIDLASNLDRQDVLIALERIQDYITKGNWPPA